MSAQQSAQQNDPGPAASSKPRQPGVVPCKHYPTDQSEALWHRDCADCGSCDPYGWPYGPVRYLTDDPEFAEPKGRSCAECAVFPPGVNEEKLMAQTKALVEEDFKTKMIQYIGSLQTSEESSQLPNYYVPDDVLDESDYSDSDMDERPLDDHANKSTADHEEAGKPGDKVG